MGKDVGKIREEGTEYDQNIVDEKFKFFLKNQSVLITQKKMESFETIKQLSLRERPKSWKSAKENLLRNFLGLSGILPILNSLSLSLIGSTWSKLPAFFLLLWI